MYSVAPSLWVRVSSIHVSLGCCLTMVANHGVSNSHHIPSMVGILHHDSLPGSARVANSPTVPYSPTSVPDYIDRFATLMDQLIAYGAHTDPLYFTMCFIDGLCDDTKSAVLVQCPSNWDSVCVLAQLQEEVCEAGKRLVFRCPDHYTMSQQSAPSPMPLPLPLPPPPQSLGIQGDDRRTIDFVRTKSTDEKWATVVFMAFVSSVRDPLSIHLNVVQELFEVFQWEDDLQSTSLQEDKSPHEQVFLLVSATASCFWCSWFPYSLSRARG